MPAFSFTRYLPPESLDKFGHYLKKDKIGGAQVNDRRERERVRAAIFIAIAKD